MKDTPAVGTGAVTVPIAQLGTELPAGEMSGSGSQRACSSRQAGLFLVMPFGREKPTPLGLAGARHRLALGLGRL